MEKSNTDRIYKGFENGVDWEVDKSKFDPIIIIVKNRNTGNGEKVVYNCQYRPIFGYDISDTNEVEIILDNLINKYSDK
jgi:hypothetical protein